VLKNKIIFTN